MQKPAVCYRYQEKVIQWENYESFKTITLNCNKFHTMSHCEEEVSPGFHQLSITSEYYMQFWIWSSIYF